MKPPLQRPAEAPPYHRWFLWLLIGCVGTLAAPYLGDNTRSTFYSPSIRTYIETEQGLVPTTQRIHIDGRTAAFLNASDWLHIPMIVLTLDAAIWGIRRRRTLAQGRRASPISPSHANDRNG